MGTIRRYRPDSTWDGVEPHEYLEGLQKHELIDAPSYRVRYFEVPAGEHTALEQHPHDHGVVIQRGRARVTLGDDQHDLGPGDVVYVAPDERHCFEALGEEPLGFICVASPAGRGA